MKNFLLSIYSSKRSQLINLQDSLISIFSERIDSSNYALAWRLTIKEKVADIKVFVFAWLNITRKAFIRLPYVFSFKHFKSTKTYTPVWPTKFHLFLLSYDISYSLNVKKGGSYYPFLLTLLLLFFRLDWATDLIDVERARRRRETLNTFTISDDATFSLSKLCRLRMLYLFLGFLLKMVRTF